MPASFTDWKNCRYGGPKGGNGHRVHADKMTHMECGGVTITICEDCKVRKPASIKAEHSK